ncbi:hypothetical protein [Bifidobacterium tissieri]|uniref:hypothetical protein n=1 Tax=Bifidobacterium tissieri TaxID=1630162 RepID=UPI001239C165|nr:hypothetical protein [Bifidobacterium tissieri]KAA8832613.1 hypothetical protein EM849_03665 [Bifidobacterium tissieri]
MVQLIRTIDIPDRLRLDVLATARERGYQLAASCTPLPEAFTDNLPFAWFRMLGGTRSDVVLDSATISVGVYGVSWANAVDTASLVHAIVMRLPFDPDRLTDWKQTTALSLPYEDPDPDHPTVPRVSFTCTVSVKSEIIQ